MLLGANQALRMVTRNSRARRSGRLPAWLPDVEAHEALWDMAGDAHCAVLCLRWVSSERLKPGGLGRALFKCRETWFDHGRKTRGQRLNCQWCKTPASHSLAESSRPPLPSTHPIPLFYVSPPTNPINKTKKAKLTAIPTHAALTQGLSLSPTLAHFQNTPNKPDRCRSMGPGKWACT